MRVGGECRRRRDETSDHDPSLLEILRNLLELGEGPEHGHPAKRLSALGRARREDATRPQLLHRAELDGPEDDLDVGRAPEEQRGSRTLALDGLPRAGVFEVAIGEARAAEQRDLDEPVQRDRDLPEEVDAVEDRRDQHVVDDKQRERQHRRGTEDIGEVGKRGEAPFRLVQREVPIDQPGEGHEERQEGRQVSDALVERLAVESHDQRQKHGERRRHEIVEDDR